MPKWQIVSGFDSVQSVENRPIVASRGVLATALLYCYAATT